LFDMVYTIYTLFSESTNKYYVGQTVDLDARIGLHNTAEFAGSSTKFGIPWIVYYTIECERQVSEIFQSVLSKKIYFRISCSSLSPVFVDADHQEPCS